MLCPPYGVADGCGLVGAGGSSEGLGSFEKFLLRDSGVAFNHLRGVPGEVALQNLVHAAGMFESCVELVDVQVSGLASTVLCVSSAVRRMACHWSLPLLFWGTFVDPGFGVVLSLLFVPAREDAVQIFSVAIILLQNDSGIRVRDYVIAEYLVVREHVVNEAAEKEDVG